MVINPNQREDIEVEVDAETRVSVTIERFEQRMVHITALYLTKIAFEFIVKFKLHIA